MSQPVTAPPPRPAADGGRARRAVSGTPARLPGQRRRSMLALGVTLTALGGLGGAWAFTSAAHQRAVLVAARAIPQGTVITRGELGTATISGSGVASIPASQAGQVAGRTAATGVAAGSLLAPGDLTSAPVPRPGQQLVPVTLKADQIPASGLVTGDQVLAVATPGAAGAAGGQAGPAAMPAPVPATVYQVGAPDQSGNVTVDLLVTAVNGPPLARQDSTGQIALILTTPRPSGRGFRPSPTGVPVSPPAAPGRTRSV